MSHANPFRLTVQSAPVRDAVAITPEQTIAAIACKRLSLKERAMLAINVWGAIVAKCGQPSEMSPLDCRLSHVNWIEKLLLEVSPTTLKEHVGLASGSSVTDITTLDPLHPLKTFSATGFNGKQLYISLPAMTHHSHSRPHST